MSLSYSPLRYGLALLLLPNVVFATGVGVSPLWIICPFIGIILFSFFLHRLNQNKGSAVREIGRILFAFTLFVLMIIAGIWLDDLIRSSVPGINTRSVDAAGLEFLNTLDFWSSIIIPILPACLAPIIAHKIIK